MTYYSLVFPLFFAAAVLAFWLVPPKAREAVLLAAGVLYMASWGGVSLGVLAAVTLLTWACGRGMAAAGTPAGRRAFLVLGLAVSAGFLFARKALPLLAPGATLVTLTGLAFYALQAASYLADVYTGRCPVQKNLLRYAVYMSFFPRVLSGPIGRAEEFFPQLDALRTGQRRCEVAQVRRGLIAMLGGWAEKLVLANLLSAWVNAVYAQWTQCSAPVVLAGGLFFGFSLYFDFAGYSHLALGAARTGGTATVALNGANEAAVGLFLAGKISFGEIAQRVEHALASVPVVQKPDLEAVLAADAAARAAVETH